MVADGIRAPMGYGAQRVMMPANMDISENTNTPCHHLVAGRMLPAASLLPSGESRNWEAMKWTPLIV